MQQKKIAIIGDGKIALDCISVVSSRPELDLCAYVYHQQDDWSGGNLATTDSATTIACANVNDAHVREALAAKSPDLIVNANSFDILREPLIDLAKDAVINFHNGPLPQYRGMNIPTWAIFNGEREHGVTWHLVVRGIDTGDIVAQSRFPIEANETAITLVFKCLAAGLELFERLIGQYVETGTLRSTPQAGVPGYYRAAELPNGGYIDFHWPREQLSRFARSLTFRPFSEKNLRPRFRMHDQDIYAETLDVLESCGPTTKSGTVLEVTAEGLIIAARDARISLWELSVNGDSPIAPGSLGLVPGNVISRMES